MVALLWVGLGGALGALARFGVQRGAVLVLGEAFPWGTLAVNLLGSFAFGWLWHRVVVQSPDSEVLVFGVLAGFLGAFTTFATFAFETSVFLRQEHYLAAGLNLAANNVLGIGLFLLGNWLARRA